ncbi:MAG: nitroreductase family protein [Bacteroidota bacterium]
MKSEHKKAKTIFPVLDLLRERWSPRSFTPDPISEIQMNTLLEAASWSFSASNLQPWYYYYSQCGTHGFDTILNCLVPANQVWAKNAAVLMVSLAKKEREPGKPNIWSKHDLGAANMLMILQALSMNIYGHLMGGFDQAKIIEAIGIDISVYEPVACIALGYRGDPEKLDSPFRERELEVRTRKPIAEILKKL